MRYKGAVRGVAILMELHLRSILDLEGSPHPGYISLASANDTGHRCWVRKLHLNKYECTDHVRLPATPIRLAARYSNLFSPINKYWPPSMWCVVL